MPPAERRLTRLVAAPGGALALTDDDAALAVSEAGVCSPATLPAPSASPAPELRDGVLWQDGRALGLAPDAIAALVPLPDGDLVATGNGLSRWSPRAGLLAAEAVPTVQALPTADGARLLCVHADGTLALRAANDLAVLVAWAADAEGGAVAWLPDGRYAAPRQSTGAIAFVRGLELVEVEQFDLALNRPDQVLLAGGLADGRSIAALRQAHERRVARLGRQPSGPDSIERLPQLSFADGGPPATTAADSLTLRLAAQGRGAGLRALRVEVDGVPLHGRDGLPLAGAPARWEDAITVPLRPGPNRLRVAVEDAEGRESLRRVAVVVCTAAPRPATTHLIAFGVGAYADERWRLQYAAKDARDLAGRLGAAPGARINATVLTDASATRAALRAARSALAATAVQDRAILFVAGHGVLDARYDYWFAPADMDFAAPEARGIPFAELEELLDGIPARDRLLLIDTCHSGELDRDGLGAAPARPVGGGAVTARGFRRLAGSGPPAIDFLDLRRGVGASVLTSSSGAEFAFESDAWRNGVFTYALLAGLAGAADGDGDGQVRVSELHRHVVSEVVRLTGGEQRPTARVENLGNDFAVARTR